MYLALYPVLTVLDIESRVPSISAAGSQNERILAETLAEKYNTLKGEDILQFS